MSPAAMDQSRIVSAPCWLEQSPRMATRQVIAVRVHNTARPQNVGTGKLNFVFFLTCLVVSEWSNSESTISCGVRYHKCIRTDCFTASPIGASIFSYSNTCPHNSKSTFGAIETTQACKNKGPWKSAIHEPCILI